MAIISITTKDGSKFYVGANGVTKQKGRAINVYSKTYETRCEQVKQSEWGQQNAKGATFALEDSLPGALGRPKKEVEVKRGRPRKTVEV